MKKNLILIIVLFITAVLLNLSIISCGDEGDDDDDNDDDNYVIPIELNILNNMGSTGIDYFKSVIESGDYYIAVGYSDSNLSGLPGGTDTAGSSDFVIVKFGN